MAGPEVTQGQVVRVASSSKSTDPLERRTSSSAPACRTDHNKQRRGILGSHSRAPVRARPQASTATRSGRQHSDPNTSGDAPTTKGSPLATPLPSGAQTGIRSRRHLMETPPQGVQQDGRRGGERRHGRQSIDTVLSTRAAHRRGPHSQFSNRRCHPLVKQN